MSTVFDTDDDLAESSAASSEDSAELFHLMDDPAVRPPPLRRDVSFVGGGSFPPLQHPRCSPGRTPKKQQEHQLGAAGAGEARGQDRGVADDAVQARHALSVTAEKSGL